MSDQEKATQPATGPVGDRPYEETVVEYVDNSRRRRILALILVLLALLLVGVVYVFVRFSQPAGAPTSGDLPAGVTWIRSLYSFGPSPDQLVLAPTATAIGPDGTVWTLASKRYIVGFSPSGTVRKVITPKFGTGTGEVTSLEGIAIGDDGSIYVADFGNNAVDVFSPAGNFVRAWGVQLPQVLDVKGNRVAVAAANGVGVFDTQGNLIAKWGSKGSGPDQVNLPHGILIGADNNVYVSDTQNRRVEAYDQSGRLLWVKADPNRTAGNLMSTQTTVAAVNGVKQGLLLPTGITQDAAGRLLLVDAFGFQVVVMDPAQKGLIVGRYGEEGNTDGTFAYPTGISYDVNRDEIAIADTSNNRVQIIRIPGTGRFATGATRAFTSLTDTPIWLCGIPLLLLLIALILWIRRARSRSEDDGVNDGENDGLPLTE